MKKQKTNWVTVADGSSSAVVPKAKQSSKNTNASNDQAPVKNKLFWGAGFVSVIVFALVLVAPQELASILKGDLFDGTGLNVIPVEETVKNENVQDSPEVEDESTVDSLPDNQPVVEAQTDAVSIQIEPISTEKDTEDSAQDSDADNASGPADSDNSGSDKSGDEVDSDDNSSDDSSDESVKDTDSDVKDDSSADSEVKTELDENKKILTDLTSQLADIKQDKEEAGSENNDLKAELDENKKLLETLAKEVAEFKQKEDGYKKELESMHSAATQPTSVVSTPVVVNTTPTSQKTGYRINTHRVQITPGQALQQNTVVYNKAAYKRTASVASVPAKNYQAQLLNATSTPESGPRETLLISFLLTFVGMLGWKMRKMFKA